MTFVRQHPRSVRNLPTRLPKRLLSWGCLGPRSTGSWRVGFSSRFLVFGTSGFRRNRSAGWRTASSDFRVVTKAVPLCPPMNTTSKAILETLLSTDASLSIDERGSVERLISGKSDLSDARKVGGTERLLITQREVSALLSVSRITIWRMTRDGALNPVEVLPGTWRYRYGEVAAIASGDSLLGRKHRQSALRRLKSVA